MSTGPSQEKQIFSGFCFPPNNGLPVQELKILTQHLNSVRLNLPKVHSLDDRSFIFASGLKQDVASSVGVDQPEILIFQTIASLRELHALCYCEQGASVKIVVAFGQEADRHCSAGPERLDSPCGRVADALGHSTCGACQREDVLRGVIEVIGRAILARGYVPVAVHRLDPPVAAVHGHDAFRCRPGQARDQIT